MFSDAELASLRGLVRDVALKERATFDALFSDVEALRGRHNRIQPRSTTSISLVASDGGNNRVEFNPFAVQVVRVMDSFGKQMFLDVVSPDTDLRDLARRHLDEKTALGLLMADLGCLTLNDLSPMLPDRPSSGGWTLVYRDLCEWATLYELITRSRWGSDTLVVRDGLLRSKIFQRDLFVRMYRLIDQAIQRSRTEEKRQIYLVGLAKHSEVLARYAMAMSVAEVMPPGHPLFVPVPMDLQRKVYVWSEYIRHPDEDAEGSESPKYNIGVMHFVRFGDKSTDPVWTADLLASQQGQAQAVFGSLLADALDGFPVAFYPRCLQKADEHAQVAGLDMVIVRDALTDGVRALVPEGPKRDIFDGLSLALNDEAARRYG